MRQVLPPPRRVHVVLAKLSGATMWCWILWRLKHDWRDVFVSCTPVGRGVTTQRRLSLYVFTSTVFSTQKPSLLSQGHHDSLEPHPLSSSSSDGPS